MDKELALRTFGYLIEHYKTHDETIINTQEIEAIVFILKDNENLEQQCKKQKEVINKIDRILIQEKNPLTTKFNYDIVGLINKLQDILKEGKNE